MFQEQNLHLRVSQQELANLQFEPNYVRVGTGINSERRIFRNVQYDQFEIQQLKEFKDYLDSIPVEYLKEVQTDCVLLRFLYAHKFNKERTLNYFVDHLNWLNNPENVTMEEIPQYSKLVKIIGRDEMLRPVLHVTLSLPLDDLFIKAITNNLITMEDYMFSPGKIESWIVIVDLSNINPNLSTEKIEFAIKHFVTNFPMSLEHIYFLEVNLVIKQIGENILQQQLVKEMNVQDKISISEKSKFPKEKLKLLNPDYIHLFDVDYQINQSLSNPFQVFQPQPSAQSLQLAGSPAQVIIKQPQPTLQATTPMQNGELIGPLYPLVVYASSQPQPYVPQVHDRDFQIQPAKHVPTFFLDQNNQFGQTYGQQPQQYQQQPQFQQGQQQLQRTQPNYSDNTLRTKYDDLIDQFNWNRYGVTQQLPLVEPEKIISDATLRYSSPYQSYAPPTPTLNGLHTEQTVKKFDISPHQDIQSTYGHYDDPVLPSQKDFYPHISEHNSELRVPSNAYNQQPIPKFDIEAQSISQPSRKFDITDPPMQPPSSRKFDYAQPIDRPYTRKYEFNPLPPRPSDTNLGISMPVQEYRFSNDRVSDVPIATNYTPNYTNYLPPTPTSIQPPPSYTSQQPIQPQPPIQSYLQPPIQSSFQPQTLSLPTVQQQTLPYSPYQQQNPFSPIPSSTNLYTSPNYPISTVPLPQQLPSSTSPKVIEQDGIKYQDETMVVGDHDNRQTKTRDPALDQQQCIIY